MQTYSQYIGGQWVPAAKGGTLEALNPATGEVLATFPQSKAVDIDKAVGAARAAFEDPEWREMPPLMRAQLLYRVAQLIKEKAYELAQLETLNNGKPIKETTFIDIPMAAETFEYYAGLISHLYGQSIPVGLPALSFTLREPIGVIGQIIPWNYPLLMAAWKMAPALAAGNTVVLKPAELTPLTALELGKIIEAAGIPPGVVNIVTGLGAEAGEALVVHPGVDKIAFTGSTAVGKRIMELSARTLKRVSLELGGKSPNIVFADADQEAALGGALAAIFMNKGEMCTAGSRLLVQKKIYDQFMNRLVEKTRRLKLGPGLDPETEVGPCASEKQRQKNLMYIKIGQEEGAQLLCGGKIPSDKALTKGFFLEPAVFAQVRSHMRIAQEEIFGPVLCVFTFEEEEEALQIANGTAYGLAGAVWTKDMPKALRVAKGLKAGTIWINTYGILYAQCPFGGYKESGWGRELGLEGLLQYTETKHLSIDLSPQGKSIASAWFAT